MDDFNWPVFFVFFVVFIIIFIIIGKKLKKRRAEKLLAALEEKYTAEEAKAEALKYLKKQQTFIKSVERLVEDPMHNRMRNTAAKIPRLTTYPPIPRRHYHTDTIHNHIHEEGIDVVVDAAIIADAVITVAEGFSGGGGTFGGAGSSGTYEAPESDSSNASSDNDSGSNND